MSDVTVTPTAVSVTVAPSTVSVTTSGAAAAAEYASSIQIDVRNRTGSTVPKGSAVYISGATGQTPEITLARANVYSTTDVIGLVAESINNNGFGQVLTSGILIDVDTSAFAEGATLYLSSSTAGELTDVEPSKPAWQMQVGHCLYSHANHGKVLVTPNLESTKTEYIQDMTATGESLATAADAAAARTAIAAAGLAGTNVWTGSNTFNGGLSSISTTLASSTAISGTLDLTSAGIIGLSSIDISDWNDEQLSPASKTILRDDFIATGNETGEVGGLNWQYSGVTVSGLDAISGRPGILNVIRSSATGVFYCGLSSVAGIAHTDDIEYVCWIFRDNQYDNVSDRMIGLTDSPSSPTKVIGLVKNQLSYDWYVTWYDSTPIGTTPVFSHTSSTTDWKKLEMVKVAANTWSVYVDGALVTTILPADTPPIGALLPTVRFQGGATISCNLDFFSMRIGSTSR